MGGSDFQPYQDRFGTWHCGARNRQGEPCGRYPHGGGKRGPGRCSNHGGASPRGVASPHFVDGRHSKALSAHPLGPAYQASLENPDQLNLAADIALVDAFQAAAIERIDLFASDRVLAEVRRHFRALNTHMAAGQFDDARMDMAEIQDALESAPNQEAVRREILDLSERRRKLAETERRRLVDMQTAVPVETYMASIRTMVSIIKGRVDDPKIMAGIQSDVERFIVSGGL